MVLEPEDRTRALRMRIMKQRSKARMLAVRARALVVLTILDDGGRDVAINRLEGCCV